MKFEASDLGNGALGPLVDLEIVVAAFPQTKLQGFGLLDSGADNSVLPFELLIPLGLQWENLTPAPRGSQGIGGTTETRLAAGEMSHRGTTFLNGDISILEPGSGLPGPILGRQDFFATFRVDFELHKNPPIFHVKVPRKKG